MAGELGGGGGGVNQGDMKAERVLMGPLGYSGS